MHKLWFVRRLLNTHFADCCMTRNVAQALQIKIMKMVKKKDWRCKKHALLQPSFSKIKGSFFRHRLRDNLIIWPFITSTFYLNYLWKKIFLHGAHHSVFGEPNQSHSPLSSRISFQKSRKTSQSTLPLLLTLPRVNISDTSALF